MADNQRGRPTVFTPDTKDLLLEYIAAGYPVRKACGMLGVDPQGFYLALGRDPEFNERYEAAKASAVDALVHDGEEAAEKALTAENGAQVAGIKVYADYKFRMASRIAPQKWGEKAAVHVTGVIADDPQEMAKRVAFLEALQGGQNDEGPEDASEP
jgi:hypothetical protein